MGAFVASVGQDQTAQTLQSDLRFPWLSLQLHSAQESELGIAFRHTNVYVTHQEKRDLMGIAKSIDAGRPQSKLFTIGRLSAYLPLSHNSNLINCQFEVIKLYQPVLALFPFLLFYVGV